ncbi:Membrane-bound lytic murein transglycosylase A precursor [hydrothermal vent metagenome]|uniref:peptidoglycan lytic exotransglycosylase n=1 Tax=hydrothermal vent metagenome TaxID=652676 RepID=A0A1W1B980_9ZZZZ
MIILTLFLVGCSQKEVKLNVQKKTSVIPSSIELQEQKYEDVLALFLKECRSKRVQKLYGDLCSKARKSDSPKRFIKENFHPYRIIDGDKESGLLTGYYEASLRGSLTKHLPFIYPIYSEPEDLVTVDLSSIYPQLKGLRLRGRLVGKRLVPYYTRAELSKVKAKPICYVDDRVGRFFLEIQGSGRIELDNNETIYVAYANQNGHRYRSIGRYMLQKGYITRDKLSMQSIAQYLKEHPEKMDEILNQNSSLVFFRVSKQAVTGALGIELTPMRSVAIDPRYIPLGAMLYYEAPSRDLKGIVFAQDTGGAIKGAIRADLFSGYGKKAEHFAGGLKEKLHLWILLPKESDE